MCTWSQGFIEEPVKEWSKEELPSISEPFTSNDIRDRVLNLNKVMQQDNVIECLQDDCLL